MKRIVSSILTVMLMAALAGCAKEQSAQTSQNADSTPVAASTIVSTDVSSTASAVKLTPVERRDQILAIREQTWENEKKQSEYVSRKIEENGGKYWYDEKSGSTYYKGDDTNRKDYDLTDEQLKSDTATLLNLVLQKKLLLEWIFTSSDFNYPRIYTDCEQLCNGLRELELREDIGDVLFERYKQEYEKLKVSDESSVLSDLSQLDLLVNIELYGIWFTNEQIDEINRIMAERVGEDIVSDVLPRMYVTNYSLRD